jgi:hypothetical protein
MPSDPEVFEAGMTVVLAARLGHHSGGIAQAKHLSAASAILRSAARLP